MSETNDVDEETFGDAAADVDAGVGLPDFFTTKDTSGDQEFTSLMQDLKAAALADDGADSGAGGLDSLLDPRDVAGLPDFFQSAAGGALAAEALSGGGDGGGGGGGRNTSLFDPLASFDLRSEDQEDDGAALFASLGLETAEQQRRRHQQQQQHQREQQQREQQQREQHQREQQQREQQQREQQQREQQQREQQQREQQQREQQQREQQQREQQQREQQLREQQLREQQLREQQQREQQQREQQLREQQLREQQQREQQQREQLQKQLQQQQQQQQQEEEAEDFLSPPSVGGDPGERGRGLGGVLRDAEDEAFGGTDHSEWDRMQKQFEDMHKSFLQDYRQIEEDGDDGALDSAADEGKQTAFATMRQLSLDDLDPSPDDDTETEEAAAARVGGTPGPVLTGPNVLPPGAKTLEELEAAMITVSPASIRSPPSLAAVARAGTTPPGLTRSDGLAGTSGMLERQAASGDKRIVRGAGEGGTRVEGGGRGGEERRQEEVVVSSQGMAWRQGQHQHLEHQQQQKQHAVGIQAQLGGDGVPPQVNVRGGARAGPPPPPSPVGQHRQGGVMLPSRSGHALSTVGGLPPSPQMGNAMLQGRKPPHHFQQHQHHQQLQQHQQHQQHQQQGFPGFPSPGMPFQPLPPHMQAHLMQRRAMAHGRTTGAPPRPSQPPHPPRFGSGGGSGGGGGGSAPGLPVLPQQQQHLQQQQQQQHSGGSIPRSGVLTGVPMMSPGQQAFTQRESGGGGGVRAPPGLVMPTLQSPTPTYPHPPTPWFGRPPMPPPSPILTPQQQHLQQHHHMQHIQHMHGGSGSRPDARPPLPPLEMFPRGELMTAYDTRYVIMAQMRALETPDPFNDDFYFHNAMRRKQERSLQGREGQGQGQGLEGLRGGDAHARARETAPAMPMPLPVWQETKEIARKVKDEQADAVKKRIRQWESENRVLGHHARSDVHRPRALLSLSGAGGEGEDGEGGSTDGDVLVSGGAPFETHLWRARLAIQRATKAMLAAYELNYLLNLPTTPHAKKVEVAGRLRNVIVDLAVSLGLQRSILQQDDGRPPPDASTLEASLDLRVLSTVLELTKGQKLLSRCLTMLPPGQRSALVPSVLALTLARAPAANLRNAPSDQVKADAIKAEEALAHELKNVVQSPASLPLPILRRCVELVMTAHRGRGSLAAALGSVSRAEVLAAVLRKGGELSEAEGGEAAADWAELQAEFIAMAKESPTGSQ